MKLAVWMILGVFSYGSCTVLMPCIPKEAGFGIGGFESFNGTWQPLMEQEEIPPLKKNYEIADVPRSGIASKEFCNCPKKGMVEIKQFPERKKISIIHELSNFSLEAIKNSDYIVYMNKYQQQIVEEIVGIKKPCLVLPCHPIPYHMAIAGKARKKNVYLGGHFFSDKSDGLIQRLESLVKKLDEKDDSRGANIACYFVVAFTYTFEPFNRFKADVAAHPLLKDRVAVIQKVDDLPYLDMLSNMAECQYTYLWRNELSLQELKDKIAAKDNSLLKMHRIGESSMLANAVAMGCIPIVDDSYRFQSYFETDLKYSYQDFVKDLVAFIKRVDEEEG